jgi:cell division protein FtsI (penicillin-binding protein 3)
MVKGRKKKKERTLWDEDLNRARLIRSKKRAHLIEIILFFCFSAVFVRLFFLMVLDHEELMQKAEQQYKKVRTLKPHRGVIWDNNMRQMAVSVETKSLYAVPSQIQDVRGLTRRLAPILMVSEKELRGKILSRSEKDFLWIKTSHILGYTNIDNDGLDGIELRYDQYIKGKTKKVWLGRDARGYGLSKSPEDGLPGNDLILTIDENIQYIVEREINDALKEWKAEAVVAIMMNPETGAILAMANMPTYDVNYAGKSSASKRRNRAITDIYEPGSTFKAILAVAALEEKVARLDEDFDVSKGVIRVPGGRIRDVHRHKILTFKEVIQKSSNVGAVQLGMKLVEERYYRHIKSFGFGEKTGIDLIGEVKGLLRSTENWSGRSLASLSIGQEIGTTPLQILRAYGAISNGGNLMRPFIVSRIISPSGEVIKHFSPAVERRVMSEGTSKIMRDILRSVVEEGGTARKASIRGNFVAGKTGTAQMIDPETRRYSSSDYVSSFVGFVPADNPEIALIVVVYKPRGARYGGVVAAPVFRKIVEHTLVYLDIPMGREDKNVILVSTSE